MRRPSASQATWWLAVTVGIVALLLAGLLGYAMWQVADDRDRAWAGMEQALDEVERVRTDAVDDRLAMRARVDDLLGEIDELRAETRLLRSQVESLQEQVRELGGEPAPPPDDLDPPVADPGDLAPERPAARVPEPSSGYGAASEPDLPGGPPSHANRPADAGPPGHAQGGQQ